MKVNLVLTLWHQHIGEQEKDVQEDFQMKWHLELYLVL